MFLWALQSPLDLREPVQVSPVVEFDFADSNVTSGQIGVRRGCFTSHGFRSSSLLRPHPPPPTPQLSHNSFHHEHEAYVVPSEHEYATNRVAGDNRDLAHFGFHENEARRVLSITVNTFTTSLRVTTDHIGEPSSYRPGVWSHWFSVLCAAAVIIASTSSCSRKRSANAMYVIESSRIVGTLC